MALADDSASDMATFAEPDVDVEVDLNCMVTPPFVTVAPPS
jgi:hypothetical protein